MEFIQANVSLWLTFLLNIKIFKSSLQLMRKTSLKISALVSHWHKILDWPFSKLLLNIDWLNGAYSPEIIKRSIDSTASSLACTFIYLWVNVFNQLERYKYLSWFRISIALKGYYKELRYFIPFGVNV